MTEAPATTEVPAVTETPVTTEIPATTEAPLTQVPEQTTGENNHAASTFGWVLPVAVIAIGVLILAVIFLKKRR